MTDRPGRRAPFAARIHALSPHASLAGAAAADLARTAGLSGSASPASPGLEGELVADLLAPWLPPNATVQQLRDHLAPLAADAPALHAELTALRHDQHEALHQPEWADVVARINALSASLGEARAALAAANAERLAIDHLLTALATTQDVDPEAARASFGGLLAALDVIDPAPGITVATDWLLALKQHLSLRRPIVDLAWTTLTGTTDSLYDDLAEILG